MCHVRGQWRREEEAWFGEAAHDGEGDGGEVAGDLGVVAGLKEVVEATLEFCNNPGRHRARSVREHDRS